jgi:hypothetical protein
VYEIQISVYRYGRKFHFEDRNVSVAACTHEKTRRLTERNEGAFSLALVRATLVAAELAER